jgi:hypothetical protein
MGLAAHVERAAEARYWMSRSCEGWHAMIENRIRTLLDAPEAGEGAPTLASMEDLLTSAYARAMAIEGEQWRLQRRVVDVAMELADEYSEPRARELGELARELRALEDDLAGLRSLICSLRARANDVRANAA